MPIAPDVVTVHRHFDDWIHKCMQSALHASNFLGILSTLHEFYAYGALFLVSHHTSPSPQARNDCAVSMDLEDRGSFRDTMAEARILNLEWEF
jgi:hypothetical protein